MSSFIHLHSSCFQEETRASLFFVCLPRYFLSIHWHHALWCHHIHECKSHHMHLAVQLTRSSWAPTISLDSHQNIRLHTGARVNVVLLTYLLTSGFTTNWLLDMVQKINTVVQYAFRTLTPRNSSCFAIAMRGKPGPRIRASNSSGTHGI